MTEVRNCPICNSSAENATLFMEEKIDISLLSSFSFSSRKVPEWMCHLLLQCNSCGLVYAPSPPSEDELAIAYHQATYDTSEEATSAATSYMTAVTSALANLSNKASALEIGTGNGIFLDFLLNAGFQNVVGVEPSLAAIESAPIDRQAKIRHSIFIEDDFAPNSFDLICCFMTLEHVRDPMALTEAAYRLLRYGGIFICVTHDYNSWINRLLGKRSPIIDIEHMQLFSYQAIKIMFQKANFVDVRVTSFLNRYSLQYWLRLTPLPKKLKFFLGRIFSVLPFRASQLGVNVGNIMTIGVRH